MQQPDAERLRGAGHPPLDRPYFAEYLELLESGGAGFTRELSYDRYFLGEEEADPALERYLRALIDHAAAAGRRPVLCFVRSPMRSLWMRRRFPGLHIAQLRNPHDQWCSFRRGGARSYFTAGMLLVAKQLHARAPGALSHLAGLPGPRGAEIPRVQSLPEAMRWSGAPIGAAREYAVFMLLWLTSALQSLSAADMVLDCDRISGDTAARSAARARLAEAGLQADLADAAVPHYERTPLAPRALEAVEALCLRQLAGDARPLALFDAARVEATLEHLSPLSRALLARALASLVT